MAADPNHTGQHSAPGAHPARGAYFPLRYYVGFLEYLAANPDLFEVITYDDLAWDGDFDFRRHYPHEHAMWKRRLSSSDRAGKIHVLIQHDVDSRPERTHALLREESRLAIPSNIMIFNRRHDRKLLKHYGALGYTDYNIDTYHLQHLETLGFVVGYHTNAVEQAGWSLPNAIARFRDDLETLRAKFRIRYFSPHGGVPGPDGSNNRDIPIPEDVAKDVRWVHNGHTPRFDGNYSDGGINNPKRDIRTRDLRDFVRTWRRGGRYRVLIHPQYYDDTARPAENLSVAHWYREIFAECAHNGASGWESVPAPPR